MNSVPVVVVNPPNPPGYVSNKDSMGGFGQLYPAGAPPFPPLDLPYLAAHLADGGRKVDLLDCCADELDPAAAIAEIRRRDPRGEAALLVRTSLPTIDLDLAFCERLRREVPCRTLGLFGPVIPSLYARVTRETCLDFAVLGEPDRPVADVVDGRPLAEIPGLAWRAPDGWRRNAELPPETDLDAIPFPRWDLLPVEKYVIPKSSTSGRRRFLPMLSSRGCPYGCSYCPYPVGQGLKWRFRSPKNVVDEMERLRDLHQVDYVLFRDPMFSLRQDRVREICEEILRRGLKTHWKCETRVDCLDPETIAIMARAGCTGINFGVESTDPVVQAGVHRKPILVEEFVAKVALCRRHDIKTFAFFIVGLPGDTVESILATVRFAVELRATWVQFTTATPFKGTPLHDWAVERGFVAPDFYQIVSSHVGAMGNEVLTPETVRRLHRFAQFLQNNLVNRRGVLKNEERRDLPYRALKAVADAATGLLARAFVAVGSARLRRALRDAPPRVPAAAPPASAS